MILVITKPTLDGIVATSLLKKAHSDSEFRWLIGYSGIPVSLEDIKNNELWTLGVPLAPETQENIRRYSQKHTTLFKGSMSLASEVFYQLSKYNDLQKYLDLVDMVNSWEQHTRKNGVFDPRPIQFNTLLFALGFDRFIDRIVNNHSIEFTETEQLLLTLEDERKSRSFEQANKKKYVLKWHLNHQDYVTSVVFANACVSEMAHYVLRNDQQTQIALVVNLNTNMVAVRARDKNLDLRPLVKQLGGGGHNKASGFPVPTNIVWEFINKLLQLK